jgi:hypothetical protein
MSNFYDFKYICLQKSESAKKFYDESYCRGDIYIDSRFFKNNV